MCCLKYEEEHYSDAVKKLPKQGDLVKTPDGKGTVLDINLFKETVKVQLQPKGNETPKVHHFDGGDITVISKSTKDKKVNKDKEKFEKLDAELKKLMED